jgi:RNA polymerase sigma factor for flagellar operon FliA
LSAAAAPAVDHNGLVEAHLSLVEPIARRLARTLPRSFALEDLIAAGRVGLVEAARRYSPAAHGGAPFSSFARPRIRGAILDSVRRAAFIEATRPGLADSPEPAAATITEAGVDRDFLGVRVAAAIRALPALQRRVLLMYYDDGLRLRAVGSAIGKGHSRASKLHMEAIRSLRRRLDS